VILLDTSGLLAAADASQRHHAACRNALAQASPPLLLSPFVLAELDYLVMRHVGPAAQRALLDEVAAGAYQLEPFDAADVERAAAIIDKYGDLALGLADASLVVAAERHSVGRILTLDRRRFRALRYAGRRHFKLLPFD
jgi:predicted nucleic acid-binding protein